MTAQDLFSLPPLTAPVDRWLFEGELIERWNGGGLHTPAHAATVANLSAKLAEWCRRNSAFRAFGYGCPYLLESEPDSVVTFDASIVRRTALGTLSKSSNCIEAAPVLAVEVIETDEDADLLARLVNTALQSGVETVWVVDPDESSVIVHQSHKPSVHLNGGMWLSGGADLPGFRFLVAEIFE